MTSQWRNEWFVSSFPSGPTFLTDQSWTISIVFVFPELYNTMAGLELLYTSVASSITSPQDAVVCFIHWEIVKSGYKCLGAGDEVRKETK